MTSQVLTVEFAKATRVRIGVPADQPSDALRALGQLFTDSPEVVSGRLGLMEVLPEDRASYFTYVVGIECEGSAHEVERKALGVLQGVPAGRWPVSVAPLTTHFFTSEAIVFYSRKTNSKTWLQRLLSR